LVRVSAVLILCQVQGFSFSSESPTTASQVNPKLLLALSRSVRNEPREDACYTNLLDSARNLFTLFMRDVCISQGVNFAKIGEMPPKMQRSPIVEAC
jgi:hypothetical protein